MPSHIFHIRKIEFRGYPNSRRRPTAEAEAEFDRRLLFLLLGGLSGSLPEVISILETELVEKLRTH
jgi:hypothetical protein